MAKISDLEDRLQQCEMQIQRLNEFILMLSGRERAIEMGLRALLAFTKGAKPQEWQNVADTIRGFVASLDDLPTNPAMEVQNAEIRRIIETILSVEPPEPPKPPDLRVVRGGRDGAID